MKEDVVEVEAAAGVGSFDDAPDIGRLQRKIDKKEDDLLNVRSGLAEYNKKLFVLSSDLDLVEFFEGEVFAECPLTCSYMVKPRCYITKVESRGDLRDANWEQQVADESSIESHGLTLAIGSGDEGERVEIGIFEKMKQDSADEALEKLRKFLCKLSVVDKKSGKSSPRR